MDIFQVIVLSVIEGLTEFIPISSTGHLVITEKLFNWNIPFAFNLIIQLGAFSAVLFYFRPKITAIVKAVYHFVIAKINKKHFEEKERLDARLGIGILIASIPAGIVGILFSDFIEANLHSGVIVAICLIAFGFVMSIYDKKEGLNKSTGEATIMDIVKVGLWQMLALIPGVSRSGSTMSGALSLGFKRESAAEISFLIGLPIVIGSGLKGIWNVIKSKDNIDIGLLNILIGFSISFIVGFFAIKFLVKFLKTNSFKPFILYRYIAGVIFLILFVILKR